VAGRHAAIVQVRAKRPFRNRGDGGRDSYRSGGDAAGTALNHVVAIPAAILVGRCAAVVALTAVFLRIVLHTAVLHTQMGG